MRSPIFLLGLLLFSCSTSETVTPPADIIPEDQMVKIMAEVHLLEATLDDRSPVPVNPQSIPGFPGKHDPSLQQNLPAHKDTLGYYDIFPHFSTTREKYELSMKWYTAHPDVLHRMYEKVISELTRREAQDQAGK